MAKQTTIRKATTDDYGVIADVMFDAVRHGRSAYSDEQRQAWVTMPRAGAEWTERLNSQSIFVAENARNVVGFMSLAGDGYIDFAFIRPSAQGSGVFRRLYDVVESLATQIGERRLWVHASVMAQPAFTSMGFSITQRQTVEINGQSLQRFEMEKNLSLGPSDTMP